MTKRKRPPEAPKRKKRVEVPKTRKSPNRNKEAKELAARMKEHTARMKEFNKPENVAKRAADFKKLMDEARRERLSGSDGHKPKTAEGTRKFKVNKKPSSSVALPKRDSKEHETAVKERTRWDEALSSRRKHLFKKGI